MAADSIKRTWSIYKITCLVTGKAYIGLTCDRVDHRWSSHICRAMKEDGKSKSFFHKAIQTHGRNSFVISVIDTARTIDEASIKERAWILSEKTMVPLGYNSAKGGSGVAGVRHRHSFETAIISLTNPHDSASLLRV